MTETTIATSPQRPLVTFGLIAYNQRQYIEAAVAGALSQTYRPLEIILSDDCSTDDTFELMRAAADRYEGPHIVRARQNSENLGILQHVRALAREARGSILVLAAGDDVSLPQRTGALVAQYEQGADAVCSLYDLIDETGEVIRRSQRPLGSAQERLPWLTEITSPTFIYGATSSYRTEIVTGLPDTRLRVMSEDTALNTFIQIENLQPRCIEEALVLYRAHRGSVSNSHIAHTYQEIVDENRREQQRSALYADILLYIEGLLRDRGDSRTSNYFKDELEFLDIKARWSEMKFISRVKTTLNSKDGRIRRWCSSRMGGEHVYAALKWLHNKVFDAPVLK